MAIACAGSASAKPSPKESNDSEIAANAALSGLGAPLGREIMRQLEGLGTIRTMPAYITAGRQGRDIRSKCLLPGWKSISIRAMRMRRCGHDMLSPQFTAS